jgi:hypothetical protein
MAARAAQAGLEFTAYPHVPPWPERKLRTET